MTDEKLVFQAVMDEHKGHSQNVRDETREARESWQRTSKPFTKETMSHMYLENFIQKEIIIKRNKPLIINKTSKTKIGKQKP